MPNGDRAREGPSPPTRGRVGFAKAISGRWLRVRQDILFWLAGALVAVIIPVLLAVGWSAVMAEDRQEEAEYAAIEQSWARRAQLQKVGILLREAESSHRSHLITGDRAAWERMAAHEAKVRAELAQLGPMFAGDFERTQRLRVLQRTADQRFQQMHETSELRDRAGLQAIVAQISRRTGAGLSERLAALTAEMTAAEAAELESSPVTGREEISRVRLTATVSFALVVLALVAATVMAARYRALRSGLLSSIRAEAERRQAIFDSAMDAIVTLNPSGGIETVNRTAERMFGYAPEELLGRDISVLVPLVEDGEGTFIRRLGDVEAINAGHICEFEARRKDGSSFPVDVNLGQMAQPDGAHVVAVMRDCTERKRAERAKDEFVSTVSHELRTPLTSIAGSLGLLTAGAAGELPERANRLVTIAESNSRRLVRLINDILDMEKIQSGKLTFSLRQLDLAELVRRSVEDMGGLAAELGVRFACDAPSDAVTVQGDPDRLTQVLANLLSNAAKFSPRGGRVLVSVSAEGARGRVSVKDEGPGIPPEFRDRIFGKFAQADASDTRQKGGTGLGLAISKEIVERHGGRIWFDSPPGEGAVFHVELPLAAERREVRPKGAAGPNVLLCEDDADVSRVLTEALAVQGFHATVAPTLREAEEALAGSSFEALLLDLRLPDGNGLSLLRKLRRDPATRSLPVIVISGDARRPLAGGLDLVDWIEKPVDMARLQAALTPVAASGKDRPLVLHVDDDPDLRHLVEEAFQGCCRLLTAESLAAARDLLKTVTPQLVILDVGLPDGWGLELLPELADEAGHPLPVVIFSAQHVENAAAAEAVHAVLTKSRTSLDQLISTVQQLCGLRDRQPEEAAP